MQRMAPDAAQAIVKANAAVMNAVKDSKNPVHRSDYASLEAVLATVKPVYADHGLAIMQFPGYEPTPESAHGEGVVTLETLVIHESGETVHSASAAAPVAPQTTKDGRILAVDAEKIGSAITYLRRYSLVSLAGIGSEDDDGNGTRQAEPAVNLADFAKNVAGLTYHIRRVEEQILALGDHETLDEGVSAGLKKARHAIATGNVVQVGGALDWIEKVELERAAEAEVSR